MSDKLNEYILLAPNEKGELRWWGDHREAPAGAIEAPPDIALLGNVILLADKYHLLETPLGEALAARMTTLLRAAQKDWTAINWLAAMPEDADATHPETEGWLSATAMLKDGQSLTDEDARTLLTNIIVPPGREISIQVGAAVQRGGVFQAYFRPVTFSN